MNSIQRRALQGALIGVEIDLGSGTRAYAAWKKLDALLPVVKQVLRKHNRKDMARLVADWQLSNDYRVDRLPQTWTMELDGLTWQALSSGLRHSGTKGQSMYSWLLSKRIGEFAGGDKGPWLEKMSRTLS